MALFDQVAATFWDPTGTNLTLPPLTDDLITEAERQLGVTLPADLLHLLRKQNGGVVSERWDACPAEANFWADGHVPLTPASVYPE